jgi:hypothetical protein
MNGVVARVRGGVHDAERTAGGDARIVLDRDPVVMM